MALPPEKPKRNTLLDNVRKQLEQPQAPVGGMTDETERARGLLRAKLGKATGPEAGPRKTSMLEQQTAAQAMQQGEQQALQGALVGQELVQQEEQQRAQEAEQMATLAERRKDMAAQFEQRSDSILQDLERGKKELDVNKQLSNIEQLGFMVRLQNDQYVNQLQQAGQRARLDNELSFREQLARQEFADDEMLANLGINYQRIAGMDDRNFKEQLSKMDLEYASAMGQKAIEQEATASKYQGIGQIIEGGAKGYDEGLFSTTKAPAPDSPTKKEG